MIGAALRADAAVVIEAARARLAGRYDGPVRVSGPAAAEVVVVLAATLAGTGPVDALLDDLAKFLAETPDAA